MRSGIEFDPDGIYVIEGYELQKIASVMTQLHNGSDRDRDFGHKIWLVLTEAPLKLPEDSVLQFKSS